ncbi:hypothetical protein [Nocardiopsis sp. JB363]|uniref:hypothetical protein n=1 Tax=Nocardiopsis sp. JB363 TaxID=1434837 RepID=UPI00117C50C8|nr:hypothetical protein [Nocardiopsis sp. JB363]
MSKMYWNSPTRTVKLLGTELHWAHQVVNERTISRLDPDVFDERHFRGGGPATLTLPDGWVMSRFFLKLNTAMIGADDPTRLVVRLVAQTEIHGWVNGPNRAWLADIIERGLAEGTLRSEFSNNMGQVFRPGEAWQQVVTLLRERSDEPVVLSYSVSDGWPNPEMAGSTSEFEETFPLLSQEEQWRLSLEGLRAQEGLEMRPDDWETFRFGHGLSVDDI